MSEQTQQGAVRTEPNPALGQLAVKTFHRDLPRWLKERPGQRVAYHGDKLIGFAATARELYQLLEDRLGIPGQEYAVFCIEEQPPLEFDDPYEEFELSE